MNIKFPVRASSDLEIIDSENRIIVPTLLYQADIYHVNNQKEICNLIVDLLNENWIKAGKTDGISWADKIHLAKTTKSRE